MLPELLDLLSKLVAIDSRNTLAIPEQGRREADEQRVCAYLVSLLEGLGFRCAVTDAVPGRPNLVACREVVPGAPFLAFEAHMDTVGTAGMTVDPFRCTVRDGKAYGRGTCDTKGAMAAMLKACERLISDRIPVNLAFIGSCAEETGCEGIRYLDLSHLNIGGIVVGEPTENRPVVGHKANAFVELICRGKAAHGACPEAGVNAVSRMARVVLLLEETIAPRIASLRADGFTPSTLSVNIIRGGYKDNIVPDTCTATLDIRVVPGAPPLEDLIAGIARECSDALGFAVEIGRTHLTPGLGTAPGTPLAAAVRQALEACGLEAEPATVGYCTDAGILSAAGHDAIVLGPGSILQAHKADEYVDIGQLERAVDVYTETGRRFACAANA